MINRLGKIRVPKFVLYNELTNPNSYVYHLFANFIPIAISEDVINENIEYTGYSQQFDVIEEGQRIPVYYVIVTRDVMQINNMSFINTKFEKFHKET